MQAFSCVLWRAKALFHQSRGSKLPRGWILSEEAKAAGTAVVAPSYHHSMTKTLVLLCTVVLTAFGHGGGPRPSEVVVLCALHQMHEQAPFYSYADFSTAIERLHPDILAEGEFQSRRIVASKTLYPSSIVSRSAV